MSIPQMSKEEMNQWRLNHMKEVYQTFQISKICLDFDSENKSDALKLSLITKDLSNKYSRNYLGDTCQYRYSNHPNIGYPIMIDLSDDDE